MNDINAIEVQFIKKKCLNGKFCYKSSAVYYEILQKLKHYLTLISTHKNLVITNVSSFVISDELEPTASDYQFLHLLCSAYLYFLSDVSIENKKLVEQVIQQTQSLVSLVAIHID